MKAHVTVERRTMAAALVILALTAGLVHPAPGQTPPDTGIMPSENAGPRFSYGVRASFNVTTFSGDAADSPESGARPGAGLFAMYRISPFLALQPELLYTHRSGGMQRIRTNPPTAQTDLNLGYLDLPVLVKFILPEYQQTAPIVLAGPYVSRRITGSIHDANDVFEDSDLDDLIRPYDYGMVVGAGLERYFGRRHLNFDTRYSLGLTRLLHTDDRPDLYNRGLTFSVGLSL